MIGDRYLIDTVFGNKHGMLTIRPAPLTEHGEPKAVKLVRPQPAPACLYWHIGVCGPAILWASWPLNYSNLISASADASTL